MNRKRFLFHLADAFYIAMMVIPILCGIVLQVLTKPPSEGITVTGARVFFTLPMPLQDLLITEAQINSALVLVAVISLCLYLTHGLSEHIVLRRQILAEWIVEFADGLSPVYYRNALPFRLFQSALAVRTFCTYVGSERGCGMGDPGLCSDYAL